MYKFACLKFVPYRVVHLSLPLGSILLFALALNLMVSKTSVHLSFHFQRCLYCVYSSKLYYNVLSMNDHWIQNGLNKYKHLLVSMALLWAISSIPSLCRGSECFHCRTSWMRPQWGCGYSGTNLLYQIINFALKWWTVVMLYINPEYSTTTKAQIKYLVGYL